MNNEHFKLYTDSQFLSPYAFTVFVGLHEKQIPFEIATINLGQQGQFEKSYVAKSLTAKVPVLEHNHFALSESSAILEYLEELYPNTSIYPKDIQARARARQIQAWLRSDLVALRTERPTDVIFFQPKSTPLSEQGQKAAEKLFFVAEKLLASDAEFLFGSWSIVDAELALMLQRLIQNGDAVPERLKNYALQQWQRPTVQKWLALRHK
ncbi:glutathione transferase [Acinetobacter pittii]|uniref:Glutathione transferase n=1 Tax=Acinetobacter pittii TaxID=48296 RepID=A0A429KN56_ACIPI|nr:MULTISPECIES: glutathione transferase [Acinetobacter]MDR0071904.1 glutathione transferase [Acinetobacter sp. 11520]MDU6102245.1 glutathione transferase [Acinetobacter sp.]AMM29237.1 glutathione S-transferase [Acinetobacter pittii]EXA97559.1 glutathione S-transferase, N-terminal domain protein [Acinetobacter sp. 1295259]KQE11025.1 glutathione S-transferase [Acinetobacter pittii]